MNEDAVVVAPSSFSQRRLWLLDRLYGQGAAYNLPSTHRLTGPLDVGALQQALNEIIRRHEALRTCFRQQHDDVLQVVQCELHAAIPQESLEGLDEERRFPAAMEAIAAEAARPFDLESVPLFRVRLYRLGERQHILACCFHHTIFDGWSEAVFFNELAALYAAQVEGRPAQLAALPVQYKDFAVLQRQSASGREVEAALAHWRERLAGAPATLNFPLDLPRPQRPAHRGAQATLFLSKTLTDRLQAVSRQQNATLFMTLLSAYSVVLHRYSGDAEVMVGTILAGRNRVELEGVVGFFVNTVALRVNLDGNPSFPQLVDQVRFASLEAHTHQDVPFERVVESLHPQRTSGQMPFFQTIFVLQGADTGRRAASGLRFEQVDVHNGTSKCDLVLSVGPARDGREGLCCSLEYDTDLFTPETATRLLAGYETILTAVAADPDRAIDTLPIVGEADKKLIEAWTDARSTLARETLIHREFETIAARTPSAIAVTCASDSLTYGELDVRSNQLAARLRREGIGRGDLVAIFLERSIDAIVAHLAVLKTGAGYLPLDPAYPASRLAFMIEDAGAGVVLTTAGMADRLPRGVMAVALDEERAVLAGESSAAVNDDSGPHELAYVMYTSGSTGRPNGVRIPHRGVLRLVLGSDYVDWSQATTFLQMAPLSFDAATFEIWGALLHGRRLVVFPDRVPTVARLAEVLDARSVECLLLPTALFNLVVDERPDCLRGVSQLIVGGEAMSVPHVRRAQELLPEMRLVNGYGPTETTTLACCHSIPPLSDCPVTTIPIGRPIGGTSCLVLDPDRQIVPIGVAGELYVGGDGVALGYHNRPELTAERFVPDPTGRSERHWYRTGDRARWTGDGVLEFHGRLDSQLKVRGFRVEPGEVEAACRNVPFVRDASVVLDNRAGDARLVAFVAGQPEAGLLPEDLRHRLADQLPAHLMPAEFVVLDALPLTPNGKVDRSALLSIRGVSAGDGDGVGMAPRSSTEDALSRIWRKLLQVDAVGIHDDFFVLGGHSLLAIRMFTEIHATFGRDLPFSSLLDRPTIASLAVLLDTPTAPTTRHLSVVALKDQGTRPPLFLLHGIGNEVWTLRDLARSLDNAQPVYGILPAGQAAGSRSLHERVAAYVSDLEGLLPAGPFALGGHCSGAVTAFEIARQLRERGRRVFLLVVFDHFLEDAPAGPLAVATNAVTWVADDLLRTPLTHNLGRARSKLRLLRTRVRHLVDPDAPPDDLRDALGLWQFSDDDAKQLRDDISAMREYQFGPYDGAIHVFRARTRALGNRQPVDDMGWGRVAGGRLTVETVPGSHDSMLRPPFVHTLAARLDEALQRAFDEIGHSSADATEK